MANLGGFLSELTDEEQARAIQEFHQLAVTKEDWFYGVLRDPETNHPRVFVEQNETGAHTALTNHEHRRAMDVDARGANIVPSFAVPGSHNRGAEYP